MDKDHINYPHAHQIFGGDFNTSYLSEWYEENMEQPERKVLLHMEELFQDLFTLDHNKVTGLRTSVSQSICSRIINIWVKVNYPNLAEVGIGSLCKGMLLDTVWALNVAGMA